MAQQTVGKLNIVISATTGQLTSALQQAQTKVGGFAQSTSRALAPIKGLASGFTNFTQSILQGTSAIQAGSNAVETLASKLPLLGGLAATAAAAFGSFLASSIAAAEKRAVDFAAKIEALAVGRKEALAGGKAAVRGLLGLPNIADLGQRTALQRQIAEIAQLRRQAEERRGTLQSGVIPGSDARAVVGNALLAAQRALGGKADLSEQIANANREIVGFAQEARLAQQALKALENDMRRASGVIAGRAVSNLRSIGGDVAGVFTGLVGGIGRGAAGLFQGNQSRGDLETTIRTLANKLPDKDKGQTVDLSTKNESQLQEMIRQLQRLVEKQQNVVSIPF